MLIGMNLPKLTKLEADILNHRLDVPDCLAEVLDEYASADVEAVAEFLRKGDYMAASNISPLLTADVLQDCVEGSTYLGNVTAEGSPQREAAVYRAGCSLAGKIGKLLGRNLEYPMC